MNCPEFDFVRFMEPWHNNETRQEFSALVEATHEAPVRLIQAGPIRPLSTSLPSMFFPATIFLCLTGS